MCRLDNGDDLTKKEKTAVNAEEDDDDDNFSAKAATDRVAEAPPQVCSGWHFHTPGPLRPLFASFLEEPEQLPPTHLDSWLDSVVQPYEPVYEPVTRAYSVPRMASNEKCHTPTPPQPPASCPPDVAKPQRFAAATPPLSSPSVVSGRRSVTFSGKASMYSARSSPSENSGSIGKVESPLYREITLPSANINLVFGDLDDLPQDVSEVARKILHKSSDLNEMAADGNNTNKLSADKELERLTIATYALESEVVGFYHNAVFPAQAVKDVVKRDISLPMSRECVPDTASQCDRIITPVPDLLYGYKCRGTFSDAQIMQLRELDEFRFANTVGSMFPFLVVEFKGSTGHIWVAENQCLGGTSSCVKVMERLRSKLSTSDGTPLHSVDRCAFSVAMNNSEARLYISWRDSDAYNMQLIQSYVMYRREHFADFHRAINGIINWGRHERLNNIRGALDDAQERRRKSASVQAKGRSPPLTDAEESSSTAKRR